MLRIFDDDDTVDEHRRTGAGRVLVRVGVGGAVLEVGGIEDRDVGPVPFLEQAAVAQPKSPRCRSRHLAHGLL